MTWSFLFFLVLALREPTAIPEGFQRLSTRQRLLVLLAGVFLALHFAGWIAALQLTVVAHSVMLAATHPVFAIILSPFLLKERGGWQSLLALVLSLGGIALIVGQDLLVGTTHLYGDMLALSAALFITLYLFIARYLRGAIDLIPYLTIVYGSAALTLLILVLWNGQSLTGYSNQVYIMMFLLAAIPTGIGHSLLNWASRRMAVHKVNLAAQGETIFAALLAFLIFAEKPYGWFYYGALLVLGGIFLAMSERDQAASK